jgi:hypothetical protein
LALFIDDLVITGTTHTALGTKSTNVLIDERRCLNLSLASMMEQSSSS